MGVGKRCYATKTTTSGRRANLLALGDAVRRARRELSPTLIGVRRLLGGRRRAAPGFRQLVALCRILSESGCESPATRVRFGVARDTFRAARATRGRHASRGSSSSSAGRRCSSGCSAASADCSPGARRSAACSWARTSASTRKADVDHAAPDVHAREKTALIVARLLCLQATADAAVQAQAGVANRNAIDDGRRGHTGGLLRARRVARLKDVVGCSGGTGLLVVGTGKRDRQGNPSEAPQHQR
jgi:hypothetical protein